MKSWVIEAENLTRRYGDFVAVDQVNLTVKEGEVFGFLGPNGAGKTTTIHMLCTLLRPTSGAARVAGYDVVSQGAWVRKNIGLVFQEPTLDENLTAAENLHFHGIIYGVKKAKLSSRIEEVLRLAMLWDRRNELVKSYSGGMKRRLEIARGLLHMPRVLFLDEPTIGLDPQTRKYMWEYIHQARLQEGTTVFMTTHYMDEAENCDRIAIIDRGRIVAKGTPKELRSLVGGDIVEIQSPRSQELACEVAEILGVKVEAGNGLVRFEVPEAEKALPRLLEKLPREWVTSVGYKRPSLDDVFIKLTGRAIRDESGNAMQSMVQRIAMRRRK